MNKLEVCITDSEGRELAWRVGEVPLLPVSATRASTMSSTPCAH